MHALNKLQLQLYLYNSNSFNIMKIPPSAYSMIPRVYMLVIFIIGTITQSS
jgi:hypothetical protein